MINNDVGVESTQIQESTFEGHSRSLDLTDHKN